MAAHFTKVDPECGSVGQIGFVGTIALHALAEGPDPRYIGQLARTHPATVIRNQPRPYAGAGLTGRAVLALARLSGVSRRSP